MGRYEEVGSQDGGEEDRRRMQHGICLRHGRSMDPAPFVCRQVPLRCPPIGGRSAALIPWRLIATITANANGSFSMV
jgi:hypothetical protein